MPAAPPLVGWTICRWCCSGSGLPLGRTLVFHQRTSFLAPRCGFLANFWSLRTRLWRHPRRSSSPIYGESCPGNDRPLRLITDNLGTQNLTFRPPFCRPPSSMSGLTLSDDP